MPQRQPNSPLPPPVSFCQAQDRRAYDRAFERSLEALRKHREQLTAERRRAAAIVDRWQHYPARGRTILLCNLDEPISWSLCSLLVEGAEERVWRDDPEAGAHTRLATLACDRLRRRNRPLVELTAHSWYLHGQACFAAGDTEGARRAWREGSDRQHRERSVPHLLLLRAELEADAGHGDFARRLLDRSVWLFEGVGDSFYSAVARLRRALLIAARGNRREGAALICAALEDLDPGRAPRLQREGRRGLRGCLDDGPMGAPQRGWLAARGRRLEALLGP